MDNHQVFKSSFAVGGWSLSLNTAEFHPTCCGAQQFGSIRKGEFVLQMLAIRLDRLGAELEVLTDLNRAQATAQQLEHLQLPIGQL